MIQKIVDGVVAMIRTEYDTSYRIYTESIKQGLVEPCFSVLCLNPSGEHEVGVRYKRYFPFMITYFPSSDEPIAECNEVCENLLSLLHEITTSIGILRASEPMSGEVVDGNLQFNVQYKLPAILISDTSDNMYDLTINRSKV